MVYLQSGKMFIGLELIYFFSLRKTDLEFKKGFGPKIDTYI